MEQDGEHSNPDSQSVVSAGEEGPNNTKDTNNERGHTGAAWQRRFFQSPRSPATDQKHAVLLTAFDEFFRAARRASRNICVFDGFAGAGTFGERAALDPSETGVTQGSSELGSPLVLLTAAHRLETEAQSKCVSRAPPSSTRFVFCERNRGAFFALRNNALAWAISVSASEARDVSNGDDVTVIRLDAFGAGPWTIEVRCCLWATGATEVANELERARVATSEPPTALFSFVDPFGFDGLTCTDVARLVAAPSLGGVGGGGCGGALVYYIAASAVRVKATSTNGVGQRQALAMGRYLWPAPGEIRDPDSDLLAFRWHQLRAEVGTASTADDKNAIVARAVQGGLLEAVACRERWPSDAAVLKHAGLSRRCDLIRIAGGNAYVLTIALDGNQIMCENAATAVSTSDGSHD